MIDDQTLEDYCDRLREHVRRAQKNSWDISVSLHAIAAFEGASRTQSITSQELTTIISAAKSAHLGPFYIGTELLTSLFVDFQEVREAWKELAKSQVAHERWVAVTALADEKIPSAFAEEIIRDALKDKSSK